MNADDAAQWMLGQFYAQNGFLYQEYAATLLLHMADTNLAYYDANSNVCIAKPVLAKFNKLTSDLVYERTGKFWRHRLPSDLPGRQQ